MKLKPFSFRFRVSVYSFALLFGVWTSSFADENAQAPKKDTTPASASTATATPQERSPFYMAATFDPILGGGGRMGYRLGDWAVEFIYTQSMGYTNWHSTDNNLFKLGTVNAKYFVNGSSFYVAGGLGIGQSEWGHIETYQIGPIELIGDNRVRYNYTFLDSYIGNQWTFQKYFTVGADWAGIYWAMTKSKEHTPYNNQNDTPPHFLPILARVYVGVSI